MTSCSNQIGLLFASVGGLDLCEFTRYWLVIKCLAWSLYDSLLLRLCEELLVVITIA